MIARLRSRSAMGVLSKEKGELLPAYAAGINCTACGFLMQKPCIRACVQRNIT